MNEATVYCQNHDQIPGKANWLTNTLNQMSFQNSHGSPIGYKITH